jgi:hypothetical protein
MRLQRVTSAGLALIGAVLCGLPAAPSALEVNIDQRAMVGAIGLARASEGRRAAFHSRYTFDLGDPPAERMEIVTEFRRLVQAVEERVESDRAAFTLTEAERLLAPWRGKLTVVFHLRFHPQTAVVTMPPYDVRVLGMATERPIHPLDPLDVVRRPLYGTPPSPLPGIPGTQPLGGAVIEATFDASAVGNRRRLVVLLLHQDELASTPVDFASLD